MAAHTVNKIKSFALTGTGTTDTVTLGGGWRRVQIANRSATAAEVIWFSVDGTAVTAAADEIEFVAPSSSVTVDLVTDYSAQTIKLKPASGTPDVTVRGCH